MTTIDPASFGKLSDAQREALRLFMFLAENHSLPANDFANGHTAANWCADFVMTLANRLSNPA